MTPKQKEFLRQLDDLFNPEPDYENKAVMLATLFALNKARENQLLTQKCYKKHFNQITRSINPNNNEKQ